MSFLEVLKEAVSRVDGAVAAMIIGSDGILVEEYTVAKLLDLSDLGAETAQMIKDIKLASANLGLGEAKEFSIISGLCGIIMRNITPDYYLTLIITPDGNYGKGRFVLKSLVPKIAEEF